MTTVGTSKTDSGTLALASSLPACFTIFLSVTWLHDSAIDSKLLPLEMYYSVFRRDSASRGGIVFIAVASCFRINRSRDLERMDLEALSVEFFFARGTVLVCPIEYPSASHIKKLTVF